MRPTGRETPAPHVLVVAPPEVVLAASGGARQALALHAGAPFRTLEALAERGRAVPVGTASNERHAARLAERLKRDHGVRTRVVEPGGLAWFGLAVSALVVGAIVGVVLLITLLVGLSSWVLLFATTCLVALLGLSGWSAARWRADRDAHGDGLDALEVVRRAVDTAPEAWLQLRALREASLDDSLPPSAQADLWTAIDRVEEVLLASPADPSVLRELGAAEAVLAGRDADDVSTQGALPRAVIAARATRSELASPTSRRGPPR